MKDIALIKIAGLFSSLLSGEKTIVITDELEAGIFEDHLKVLTDDIYTFSGEAIATEVFRFFNKNPETWIVVTTVNDLIKGFPDPEHAKRSSFELRKNQRVIRDKLLDFFINEGYMRVPVVEAEGEMAVRGFIIDVFPFGFKMPVRVEFSGTTVDRISLFDPDSQRSIEEIYSLSFVPSRGCRRVMVPEKIFPHSGVQVFISDVVGESGSVIKECFPTFDKKAFSVFSAACDNAFRGMQRLQDMLQQAKNSRYPVKRVAAYIREKLENGFCVIFSCSNMYQLQRFYEVFMEEKVVPEIWKGDLSALAEERPQGFFMLINENAPVLELESERLIILSPSFIFGLKPKKETLARRISPSIRDVKQGDYVVHRDHGIGKFEGIVEEKVLGQKKEFLKIVYRDGGRLLIPVENFHLIHKYISPSGKEPVLDTLGSANWKRRTRRVKKAVEKVAEELLELYARKESAKPVKFSPPGELYEEFENTFPYEETRSQRKAIEDVIGDLTSEKVTDRLICGDVGFGKTEVALRASFKVVEDGYQVLILCPTTLLVHQHYRVFTERLENFGIKVASLSRFVKGSEKKKILQELEQGKLDILIGTHAVLRDGVKFKKLGLLIIDEEHRFGVKQKEFFRRMRENLDVISLSATPIPRTLYMSIAGIKDMSLIDTPPPDRKSVKTYISEYSDHLVKEAIERELKREGQVFFIHNRSSEIDFYVRKIKGLVPQAEVVGAHGSLPSRLLERRVIEFLKGKIHVLVSTNIIEAGLDMPRVNTILINNAHTFGMADLYQLRGRVGRSHVQAYAYLLVPQSWAMSEEAKKRLLAIKRYVEPGSGYHLALEDLEIRGAGTILGEYQSGKMEEVGMDMYLELLKKAIMERRGGDYRENQCTVKINLTVSIPKRYVPEEEMRLRIYRRLSQAENVSEVDDISQELADIYGPLPEEVNLLLEIVKLKVELSSHGVIHLEEKPGLTFVFVAKGGTFQPVSERLPYNVQVHVNNSSEIVVKFHSDVPPIERVQILRDVFKCFVNKTGEVSVA